MIQVDFNVIKDLSLFQEQYGKLADEIQQVTVQLKNSPPLEPNAPKAEQRAEWRSWLELQIATRQRLQEGLVKSLANKGIIIENLP